MTDSNRGGSAHSTLEQHDNGRQRASAAVHDAGDRARDLTETGREEVGRIAAEVKTNTSHLVDETRHRAKERIDSQVGHVASALGGMSVDLDRMADQTDSSLGSLARDGATAMRSVSRRLEQDGLDGVMTEVRHFARRRPMAFVAGAFAFGLVAGRLVRNTDVGAVAHGTAGGGPSPSGTGPTAGRTTGPRVSTSEPGGFGDDATHAFAGLARGASSADVRASERAASSGSRSSGLTGGRP